MQNSGSQFEHKNYFMIKPNARSIKQLGSLKDQCWELGVKSAKSDVSIS